MANVSQNQFRATYTDHFEHSFDLKGRITVPSEWRTEHHETILYVVPAAERLMVYPASWFSRQQEKFSDLPSSDSRRQSFQKLAALVQQVEPQQQGRILIKEKLRKAVGLEKDTLLVGRSDHFEIWNVEKGRQQLPKNLVFEDIAGELGI